MMEYMKAIETKYLCPTITCGARIKASDCAGNSITMPYQHQVSLLEGHRRAAQALKIKMAWQGNFAIGYTRKGYVFVAVTPTEVL